MTFKTIEEIKNIRNSDGTKEKTITRIIGDQVHTVVEKNSNSGKETEEYFNNFDHGKFIPKIRLLTVNN